MVGSHLAVGRRIMRSLEPQTARLPQNEEPDGLRRDVCSGAWTRTKDLRVMSPTSCHCSTPQLQETLYPFRSIRQMPRRQGAPQQGRALAGLDQASVARRALTRIVSEPSLGCNWQTPRS
jgi:hypothetical protein